MKLSTEVIEAAFVRDLAERIMQNQSLSGPLSPQDIALVRDSSEPLRILAELRLRFFPQGRGNNPLQMAEFAKGHAIPHYVSDMASFFTSMQKSTKLCSFSEVGDSILMWSHYAGNHTGFCVEYDIEVLPRSDAFVRALHPVIYSDDLFDFTAYVERIAAGKIPTINPMFPLLGVLRKYRGWDYEQEWRYVFFPNALVPNQSKRAPKARAVLLGSRMHLPNRKEIVEICQTKGIEARQMRLDGTSFRLVAEAV
jgi:hypothetical protein